MFSLATQMCDMTRAGQNQFPQPQARCAGLALVWCLKFISDVCVWVCVCLKPNRDSSHRAARKQVNPITCFSKGAPPSKKNRCSFVDFKTVMILNYQIITVTKFCLARELTCLLFFKVARQCRKMTDEWRLFFYSQSAKGCREPDTHVILLTAVLLEST